MCATTCSFSRSRIPWANVSEMTQAPGIPYAEDLIRLSAPGLDALVNPHRGGDVLSLVHNDTQTEVLWRSRRARACLPQAGPLRQDLASFYDEYPGGIQELFPNSAASTEVGGADLPFHGEACRVRWRGVKNATPEADAVTLDAQLSRSPVKLAKTISVDRSNPVLVIESSAQNLSSRAVPYSWGFHPAFGSALLDGGCRIYVPAEELQVHPDRFSNLQMWEPGTRHELEGGGAEVGTLDLRDTDNVGADLLYLTCREGWFVARNESTGLTVSGSWDIEVMPYLWVWQECHDLADFPWWGLEHVAGIEPHSAAPAQELRSLVEAGNARWLGPGATRSSFLRLSVTTTDRELRPTGVNSSGMPVFEGRA